MLWTTQCCWCYKLFRVMDDMNDSMSWAQDSRCYEQLRAMDDMDDVESWVQGFRCYEQLLTWMTTSCELKALNGVNKSRLWMTWMTRSWAQGFRYYEQLSVVVHMNDSRLWGQGSRSYEQLRVVDDMNDLGSHELRPLMLWTAQGYGWHERLWVMS